MRVGSVSAESIWSEGSRLTGGYHLSEDQVAVNRLHRLRRQSSMLQTLVIGRGVFRGPIFRRVYAAGPSHGEPYVSASDLLESHVRPASYLSPSLGDLLDGLRLEEGMILVTCSGMNLGSVIWTRPDMSGLIATHDLIRVCPDQRVVPPGYLYSFLAGRYGHAWIRKQIYGGNIKHIEPSHIEPMPIPRFDPSLELRIDKLVQSAAKRIASFNSTICKATESFFGSVGLTDISSEEWNNNGPDLAFSVTSPDSISLRALNFNPRFRALDAKLRSVPHGMLGELVSPGSLQRGKRFARVDADETHAVQLVGQKHLFWLIPKGRWVAKWAVEDDVMVEPGTILVAARGTLGETELYCRAELVWGRAAERAYSEDLLRVVADEEKMPPGCLFAFMRSETAFRLLRSISSGSKQQDHHRGLRKEIPVPLPSAADAKEIHRLVVNAYESRERGLEELEMAVTLVEHAIEEAA